MFTIRELRSQINGTWPSPRRVETQGGKYPFIHIIFTLMKVIFIFVFTVSLIGIFNILIDRAVSHVIRNFKVPPKYPNMQTH